MGEDYKDHEIKLEKVLNIILQENFKASDDVYLEKIISHLSGKFDEDLGKHLLQQSICSEFIKNALEKWRGTQPHHSIVAFCVKVASLIVHDLKHFEFLNKNNLLVELLELIRKYDSHSPAVKLSYVLFQKALIQHDGGLKFIFTTGIWKDILNYSNQNQTIYVVRESHLYIYNILLLTCKHADELFDYKEILKVALDSIKQKDWNKNNTIMPIENEHLYETLCPKLNLLNFILEQALRNNEMSDVIRYIFTEYKLEWHYWNLLSVTFDEVLLKVVIKMIVLVIFCKLRFGTESDHTEIVIDDLRDFCANSYNIINIIIVTKRLPLRVLQICELYHLYLSYIKKNCTEKELLLSKCEKSGELETQLSLLQILPILLAIKSSNYDSHIFFEEYIVKLFNIAGEHTTRLLYAFRDSLKGNSALYDVAHQAILSLLSTKSLLAQERVIIIFQALIYILKDFAPEASVFPIPKNYIASEIICRAPHLLGTILTALCTLIKDFKISWFETIESTAVHKFSLALLANTNLTSKHTIQALQLTQLGIEKYLAPTLALLLNKIECSGLEELGPIIAKKMHDPHWEVRDSALELLQTVAEMAKCKFPVFQNHLLSSNLVSLTCIVAETDIEPYVRASAWKCIKIMLRVNLFWTECLQQQDLQKKLIQVIMDDAEPEVRQEAILALEQLLMRIKVIPQNIFDVMKFVSIHNVHWEVQISALSFWKAVIQKEFHNQGMIDGSFPQVTFSRESHKIVNLDDGEIKARLILILNSLSENGCFEVFVNCLNENSELKVLQEVSEIIRTLTKVLNKYNFTISIIEQKNSKPKEHDNIPDIIPKDSVESNNHIEEKESPETIINSIVDLDDINLLTNVYNNQMKIKSVNLNEMEFPKSTVTAYDFLKYLDTFQVEEKIKIKENWLIKLGNDFGNLLDDIISCHADECASNDMDCY